MLKLFKNKYRIESIRLKNYDYSSPGAYFITICARNMEHFFGKIIDGKMRLSVIGKIVEQCWLKIPKHFSFVKLDEWIIMPNHIHGILFFNDRGNNERRDAKFCVSTINAKTKNGNVFGPQSMNLASVVRGFKIGVTKYVRQNLKIDNIWQPRFYDRIIRDELELNNIRNYIIENPAKWWRDRNNKK